MKNHHFIPLAAAILMSGCATTAPPMDFAAHQERLEAKRAASTVAYPGHPQEELLRAASEVLTAIDPGFEISLRDDGLSAGRSWSSYLGFTNVVGWDYWVVHIRPTPGGTDVFVNAVTHSANKGPFEMAIPNSSGLLSDIPLASEGGLAPEEMALFHRRLQARLNGEGAVETCDQAFGSRKRDYPLTCNRGGVTTYF